MSTRHTHTGPRTIGALLRIPNNHVARRLYDGLSALFPDLRQGHLVIFQHIDHPPAGTRLTVLAERSQVTKQALIEIVDSLEALGYVERVPDDADRRAKLIRLTAKGWDVHERAYAVVADVEAELAEAMGSREFEELKSLLARLTAALQAEPRHG